jgi:hypothetical protein
MSQPTLVFFRNDDVGPMEPGLAELGELFLARGLPLTQAVVPAALTPESAAWLRAAPAQLREVIQHGLAHAWHDRGEFGGRRSAEEQRREIAQGRRILEQAVGERFFAAMAFPWHLYNQASVTALAQCGFAVMSGIYDPTPARRVFFALGRALGANLLLGRNVSHHQRRRPGTEVLELSVSLDPVSAYAQPASDSPHKTMSELREGFNWCRDRMRVVGVLLHHAVYSQDKSRLEVLAGFLDWLNGQEDVRPASLREAHALLTTGPNQD